MIANYIILNDPDDKTKMLFNKKEIALCMFSPSKKIGQIMLNNGERFVFNNDFREFSKLMFREKKDNDIRGDWLESLDDEKEPFFILKTMVIALMEISDGTRILCRVAAKSDEPLSILTGRQRSSMKSCEKFETVFAKLHGTNLPTTEEISNAKSIKTRPKA